MKTLIYCIGLIFVYFLGYLHRKIAHQSEIEILKYKQEKEIEAVKRIWKVNKFRN